ncbi:hypothetical protein BMON_0822 [Bifidobacterium mongoliense DSM 21395]|uniref:Uncharacterized protein n=1 Tax=Bifidobacterium mongoliense DSM 21395 TaxID=1437603 RepID=A0A087C086_9BIFI|nr:hypothetical protein BMON_0822 [Bifidobacterium mongoliense DSM 21395]
MAPRFSYHPTCLCEPLTCVSQSPTCVGQPSTYVSESPTCVHEPPTYVSQSPICVSEPWVYLIKCVTGGFRCCSLPSGQRSAKVMANAFNAGFHRVTHRTWPLPVGSSERTVRWRHFNAARPPKEVPTRPDGAAEPGVQTLDRVRGADDPADLHVVVQERDEPFPCVEPQALDRRVLARPVFEHLVTRMFGGGRCGGRVDGFHVTAKRFPVLPGRVPERVAHQVNDTGLHDRQRPDRSHRVGQALQPVA